MSPVTRQLRADAQRNRDRLLEVAAHAFAAGEDPTLEAIAREAGVGIGTLYRHFPTREALVEAAYRNELARLCDAAGDLLRTHPPEAALRLWMDRFVAAYDKNMSSQATSASKGSASSASRSPRSPRSSTSSR